MKSLEEFEAFYNSELLPCLKELDEVRKKNNRDGTLVIITMLGAIGAGVYLFLGVDLSSTWQYIGVSALVILTVIICVPLFSRLSKYNYVKQFKKRIIRPIVHFVSQDLNYHPRKYIAKKEFIRSRLFVHRVARYKGDDFVTGTIDKTAIRFSEIKAEYKRKSNKNQTTYHTIFKGIFFVADFNKSFEGSTVLLPNYLGNRFNFLKKISGITRREKFVKFSDGEFMKNFNCYSDDDIKARYILSPALMQRLNNFKEKFPDNPIYVSFVDDHLYIGISHKKDLFEPKYFTSIVNFETVQSYFEDIKVTVDIVEELNLNTRIWTKK